jgi:hypothetical protein
VFASSNARAPGCGSNACNVAAAVVRADVQDRAGAGGEERQDCQRERILRRHKPAGAAEDVVVGTVEGGFAVGPEAGADGAPDGAAGQAKQAQRPGSDGRTLARPRGIR